MLIAEFRTDVESFLSLEALRACVNAGVRERPPQRQWRYVAFVDPSGGSADSMTLAVAHKEGNTCILDVIREATVPFSPEAVVEEFADTLRRYRITRLIGDRYGGEWPREQFRRHGVNYEPSERTKSQLYVDLLPLVNSRGVDLLDHDKAVLQLVGLERRTGRGGKDSIDHGPAGHDDVANAVAGALTLAFALTGTYRDFRKLRQFPPPISEPRRSGPEDPAQSGHRVDGPPVSTGTKKSLIPSIPAVVGWVENGVSGAAAHIPISLGGRVVTIGCRTWRLTWSP